MAASNSSNLPSRGDKLRNADHLCLLFGCHYAFSRAMFAPAAARAFQGEIQIVGVFRALALVNNGAHGMQHRQRRIGLEDVTSHVHARRALLDRKVRHAQRILLRQLLAASDEDGHRTRRRELLEVSSQK